jgi:hypothetical protein
MTIGKKDWVFIAIIALVLGVFYLISGPEKTTPVPYDDTHRRSYDVLKETGSKKEAEKLCKECHDGVRMPFPPNHPEPLRCLFCHKTKRPAA